MANPVSADAVRRDRRRWSEIGSDEEPFKLRGDIEISQRPTLEELRSLRTDLYTGGSTKRRTATSSRMAAASVVRSSLSRSKSTPRHGHKKPHVHRSDAEAKPRRKRRTSPRDGESSQYVYGPPKPKQRSSTVKVVERTISRQNDDSDDSDATMSVVSEESEQGPKRRKVKVIYIDRERPKSSRRSLHKILADDGEPAKDAIKVSANAVHRSNTTSSRRSSTIQPLDILKRTLSTREVRESRPVLKRSHTLSSSHLPTKSLYEHSIATTKNTSKRSSFFGIFVSPPAKEQKPPRLVECMTCLSDDIPISKSAKLKCGHRMCQSCLKRIFKLSVNDPQHMPPKCCTSNHIPLKHVDRLFDIPFKKLWNKKFQEYTTKNRIYCPARKCGEWIQPVNIHSEGGKKYGKCGRCKTKVCCLCNAKWHGNKDCPKDEATNALLEAAKKAGWQRCYNCRTMVELKEGCNHMTCRCRAEFCMICGLKWKSCNCPWFNYDQVENDRRNHMRGRGGFVAGEDDLNRMRIPEIPGQFPRAARLRDYDEELDARRRQETLDEELARRLQALGFDDDDDLNGGIGGIDGVGNARGHFMNQDYRRPAPNARPGAANYVFGINRARGIPLPPPPPLPPLQPMPAPAPRRASAIAEQVVPRRTRTDYASEAARLAPLPAPAIQRQAHTPRPAPRPSVLAGLGGAGRGSGRVSAWRDHVEPGVTPAEGVLSM